MVFDGADGSQSDQLERFSWQGLQNNYEIHYQYDANGNITQTTDGKGKIQYIYDTRNQLIREDREADRQTIPMRMTKMATCYGKTDTNTSRKSLWRP